MADGQVVPSFAPDRRDGRCSRCSCFGLLLFLWLAFGGPIPLKPKGYRFQTSFAEATQLAKEADVRISGVPGRQGQDDRARQAAPAARPW